MQTPGTIEHIVQTELKRYYIMANEPKPKQFDEIVKTWAEYLVQIPVVDLSRCFKAAAINNKKFKIPSVGQVMEEFNQGQKASGESRFSLTVKETMDRRLENPENFPTKMVEDARAFVAAWPSSKRWA